MSCTDWGGDWLEALSQFAFRDAVLCPYQTTIGGPEFATIVFGAIGISYMLRQGSVAIAAVLLIVTGGAFIGQVLGIAAGIVTIVVLTTLGLAPVYILRRMSP